MKAAGLVAGAAFALAAIAGATTHVLSQVGVHQGYAPEQPIAFSHELHAGEVPIPCLYCHYGARTSRHAGIPPASVCMNCHSLLTKQTRELRKLGDALEQGRPIRWIKIHNLPDFVYFNHSQHLRASVACQECHGPVEAMARVRQEAPLTMGWCLDCHRERHVGEPEATRNASLGASRPPAAGLDCGKCHY